MGTSGGLSKKVRGAALASALLLGTTVHPASSSGSDEPADSGPREPAAAVAPALPHPAGSVEDLWARGETAFKAGDLDEALRLFGAALTLDERRGRSWNYVGGVHFAQGDLPRALQEFRRAIELDPRDVRACNNLGTALERLGDYARAEEAYLRAVLIDPAYPLTQRNLGILQARRLGNPEGARRAWQRYLELAPNGAHAAEIRSELEALDAPPPAAAR